MDPTVEDAVRAGRTYTRQGLNVAADVIDYAGRVLRDVSEMLRESGDTIESPEPQEPLADDDITTA